MSTLTARPSLPHTGSLPLATFAAPTPPRAHRSTPPPPRLPLRWTSPVCRASVPAGQPHAHLVQVLDADAAPDALDRLSRRTDLAAFDIVRTPEGRDAWLAWSRTPRVA